MATEAGTTRTTSRMEAFSDAVFAIAITLPIVEVRLPEVKGASELAAELIGLWPSYLGYLLSFLVIGVYWSHHHFTGKIYQQVDHVFLLFTLVFLMSVTFLAFPTRVFAEYLRDPDSRQAAAIFYAFALFFASAGWLLKWLYGTRAGLIDDRLDPDYVGGLTKKYVKTTAVFASAAVLTIFIWPLGIAIALGTVLLYLRPPPTPLFKHNDGGSSSAPAN